MDQIGIQFNHFLYLNSPNFLNFNQFNGKLTNLKVDSYLPSGKLFALVMAF